MLSVPRASRPGTWPGVARHVEDSRTRRAAGAPAATLPLPAARDGETLMSDVESFTVRAWLPGQGWTETFAAGGGRNATGLEIAIARRHESAIETYRKVVLLP